MGARVLHKDVSSQGNVDQQQKEEQSLHYANLIAIPFILKRAHSRPELPHGLFTDKHQPLKDQCFV